jgi:hypothetical protein
MSSSRIYEGVIINGVIQLPPEVQLPENSRVLVTVPEDFLSQQRSIRSPRLVHPEHARDFEMEIEEVRDASV